MDPKTSALASLSKLPPDERSAIWTVAVDVLLDASTSSDMLVSLCLLQINIMKYALIERETTMRRKIVR